MYAPADFGGIFLFFFFKQSEADRRRNHTARWSAFAEAHKPVKNLVLLLSLLGAWNDPKGMSPQASYPWTFLSHEAVLSSLLPKNLGVLPRFL